MAGQNKLITGTENEELYLYNGTEHVLMKCMKKKIEAGEQKLNPVVGGLEDTEDTDALTEDEDKEEDKYGDNDAVTTRLIHLDPSNKELVKATKAYYAMYARTEEMEGSPPLPPIEEASRKRSPAFDRRNKIQVNSIMKEIYSGGKKHLLVAVGRDHLPGPYGVLDLLRKQGFTIKKVKVFDQPHLTPTAPAVGPPAGKPPAVGPPIVEDTTLAEDAWNFDVWNVGKKIGARIWDWIPVIEI